MATTASIETTTTRRSAMMPSSSSQQRQQQEFMLVDATSSSSSSSSISSLPSSYHSPQHASINSVSNMVPFPPQELSIQSLNPFPESVFSYMIFLVSLLLVWLLYLLLPRGFRKQYCGANRKRYSRRMDQRMPAAGYWLPVHSTMQQEKARSSNAGSSIANNTVPTTIDTTRNNATPNNHNNNNNTTPLSTGDLTSSPQRLPYGQRSLSNPPSPEHPALKTIPPNRVIAETMARLQGRGIRLIAHGVHCEPKRVWIRLQDDTNSNDTNDDNNPKTPLTLSPKEEPCVTWQTEFPRRIPDQNGHVSVVMMRGSLHKIVLKQILYIDVGKKTQALQLATSPTPDDTTCWSLLTQSGSLDLQAHSKLERDALVSCFSMVLDDVHEEDWRALYEASPEPSLANTTTTTTPSSAYPRGAGVI